MTAANDNVFARRVDRVFVPVAIVTMWVVTFVFALAAAGGLFG